MSASAGEMTFWDHLDDLRMGLFRVAAVLMAVTVGLFACKGFLFDSVILAPSDSDFYLYRLLGTDFILSLVNLEVTAQFMIHVKVTFLCALILSFPYLVYEIWRFIAPALYEHEKRKVRNAFTFASLLFYLGLVVGYLLIFPLMLNFFVNYQVSPDVPNTFSLSSYVSLLTSMVFTFGIVFEFPVLVVLLSALGVLTKGMMKKYRSYAIVAIVILAAIITPSGDPFSLMVVAIPLYLLYEFSVLICREERSETVEI